MHYVPQVTHAFDAVKQTKYIGAVPKVSFAIRGENVNYLSKYDTEQLLESIITFDGFGYYAKAEAKVGWNACAIACLAFAIKFALIRLREKFYGIITR